MIHYINLLFYVFVSEKRGSGFFGKIHLSGKDSVVLFTNFHAVINLLPEKHLYEKPSERITKEDINKIEKDIKTCKIFMENYSVVIPFNEILIEGSTKVSTRTEVQLPCVYLITYVTV